MNRFIVCATLCLGLASASTAAAAAFIDEHAYRAAVGGLVVGEGRAVAAVPIAVRAVRFEDGSGVFHDPAELGHYALRRGEPPDQWHDRLWLRTETRPGMFSTWLGCASYAWPCLGAWSITFAFDGPVLGFGGALDYFAGYFDGGRREPIPLLEAAFDAISGETFQPRYAGFFGIVAPMSGFTLTFRVGQNADDEANVAFIGHMLVEVVPEPGTVALFAGALGLLGLAAAPAAARRRRLSPSAGSR
jgi:hypothetical protein